jgi:hypothetical protein
MTMKAVNPKIEPGKNKVQGEGDYEAARRYDKSAQDFAQSGKVDDAARKAAPHDRKEADELKQAEEVGRSRRKA